MSLTIPMPAIITIIATITPIIPSALLNGVNEEIKSAAIVAAVAMQSFRLSCLTAFILTLFVILKSLLLKNAIQSLTAIEARRTISVAALNLTSSGCMIFSMLLFPSSNPIKNIKKDTISALIYSILPCPNG